MSSLISSIASHSSPFVPSVPLRRRLLYLGYFLLRSNYGRLRAQARIVRGMPARARGAGLWIDAMRCSLAYGASFHEYFDLRYFELGDRERREVLTTGLLHDFHRAQNDAKHAGPFRDKAKFCAVFAPFIGRSVCNLDDTPRAEAVAWLAARSEIIAKPRDGTIGNGVVKIAIAERGPQGTWEHLRATKANFAEEVIAQHEALRRLHPMSLNTVRIITWLVDDDVRILGAFLRVGRGAVIDNFTSGGVGAPVDLATGITGRVVTKEFHEPPFERHPITGEQIAGLQIPWWRESIELVRTAARVVPQVRTVGWDVAITPNGPCLVEGNDKWDKTSLQITAGKRLRHLIQR